MPSMAQFIDETGGELEEMNLQSSYEKTHAKRCFQRARQLAVVATVNWSETNWQ